MIDIPRPPFNEHFDHLYKESQRGLTTKDCIGLHATSIITLQRSIETGLIPGNTVFNDIKKPHVKLGDLCYVPIDIDGIWEAIESIEYYADAIAFNHSLLSQLNIRLDNPHFDALASELGFVLKMEQREGRELSWEEVDECAEDFGFESEIFRTAFFEASETKGVIIGLDASIAEVFPIEVDEDISSHALRMRTGKGMPVKFIRGIAPMGPVEKELLSKMF